MLNSIITYLTNHTPLLYLTQSLWRDEAFSYLVANPGGLETIKITAADYNPPLYYLLLNIWIKLFGKSEIALRSLSLIFFALLIYIAYKFARKIFEKHSSFVLVLLIALNPMLLYYGMEARMYSLYAFTTTTSMYFFYIKKWKHYIIFTTLALYTHPYTIFIPLIQGLYLLIKKKLTKITVFYLLLPFIFYLPWIFVIIRQFQNSKEMWIYPINLNLVSSVLGNLLINYEGTPWFLWKYMKYLSAILISLYLWSFSKKENRKKYLLFYLWLFFPLLFVLGVSIIKPIFVNRYIITVTVAQIFLILISINSFKNALIKKIISGLFLSLSVCFLLFLPPYIKKVDIRKTFTEVNKIADKDDLIYAKSPLVFFESNYYYKNPSQVFLFNPGFSRLPGYLGNILIPIQRHKNSLPDFPKKTFTISENGDFELYSNLSN